MALEQTLLIWVILAMVALFVSGRLPYDMVALGGLLILAGAHVIPPEHAFSGFGHPAIITVAAVLVISRAFTETGVMQMVTRVLDPLLVRNPLATCTTLCTILSSVMNNVGAVAIVMPAAMETARRQSYPAGRLLMPVAFGSLLGGTLTLIGTPVNLLISTFREEAVGRPYALFDFTPVGLGVCVVGVTFLCVFGSRLFPNREGAPVEQEVFEISTYTFEVEVRPQSPLAGRALRDIREFAQAGATLLGILRQGRRILAPPGSEQVLEKDVLLVESSSANLDRLMSGTRLELLGTLEDQGLIRSPEVTLQEMVMRSDSRAVGETVRSLDLRRRHGVNLVAVARHGVRLVTSLAEIQFEGGDVLLLQGLNERLRVVSSDLALLPLAPRGLRAPRRKGGRLAGALFLAAILVTALGDVPAQVTFPAAALAMVLLGVIRLDAAYDAIEWRVLCLLGSMLPLGEALERTGLVGHLASALHGVLVGTPPWVVLAAVLAVSVGMANIMNNKAAVVLMAPVALSLAREAGLEADPFLMAVGIGAELVFLSPVGHQSNLLVMGPGGYRFSDFPRVGVPLALLCGLTALVLIPIFWPLQAR